MRVFRSLFVLVPFAFLAGCDAANDTPEAPQDAEDAAPAHDAGAPPDAAIPEPTRDAATPPPPPPDDAGPPRAPELDSCWGGRWCWVEGAPVLALDGASRDTIYTADDGGRLWHWNGTSWDLVAGLESRRVRRVFVASASDLWVVAEHDGEVGFFVDRFDGTTWSTLRAGVDPRFLEGFGSDNVWVRDRTTLAWRRFDGRTWQAVEEPDPERLEVHYDVLYQKLMPGPAPSAYAIAVTRVDPSAPPPVLREIVVMRYDGATWSRMGALEGSGWAALAWIEDEPRVVQYFDEGSAELRFDGTRWARERWVPTGASSVGWLSGSDRGVALVPLGRSCLDVLPVGDEVFCTTLANGGIHGRIVSRASADGDWADTELPIATRPLSADLWGEVAPGYWAGGSQRAWGDGPENVLRVSSVDGILERVSGPTATRVLDAEDQPIAATQIDGVTGERAWVAAGGGVYRVSGLRAERVPMPPELEWVQVHAIVAEPGGRAWALAGNYERAIVVRIEEDVAWVDYEIPVDVDFNEGVELHDITVDPSGDVWVLGTVGHRSGHGILLHRGPGARCGPVWRTIRLWDEAFSARQVVYSRDALYISGVFGVWNTAVGGWIGGSSVVRMPLAALAGDEVTLPSSDFALGRAPEVLADMQVFATDGELDYNFSDPELWVGESGVWLTTPDAARRFVELR